MPVTLTATEFERLCSLELIETADAHHRSDFILPRKAVRDALGTDEMDRESVPGEVLVDVTGNVMIGQVAIDGYYAEPGAPTIGGGSRLADLCLTGPKSLHGLILTELARRIEEETQADRRLAADVPWEPPDDPPAAE